MKAESSLQLKYSSGCEERFTRTHKRLLTGGVVAGRYRRPIQRTGVGGLPLPAHIH